MFTVFSIIYYSTHLPSSKVTLARVPGSFPGFLIGTKGKPNSTAKIEPNKKPRDLYNVNL